MKTCNAIKEDGTSCKVITVTDQDKCLFHSTDPETVSKRKEGSRRGGQNGHKQMLRPEEAEVALVNLEDVTKIVAKTINDVRQNRVTTNQANTIGYLCGIFVKTYEIREVESKVQNIELILKKRGSCNG